MGEFTWACPNYLELLLPLQRAEDKGLLLYTLANLCVVPQVHIAGSEDFSPPVGHTNLLWFGGPGYLEDTKCIAMSSESLQDSVFSWCNSALCCH